MVFSPYITFGIAPFKTIESFTELYFPVMVIGSRLFKSGINNLYYISKHTDERGLDFLIKNGIHTEQVSM